MDIKKAITEAREKFEGLSKYLEGGYNKQKKQVHPIDRLDPYHEEEGPVWNLVEALDSYNEWLNALEKKQEEEEAEVIDDNLEPHGMTR